MPLPELIEIVPIEQAQRAEITIPGSKSMTNRALILAALGKGRTVLRGALWSEDTQAMVECLKVLGFEVEVVPDPAEPCNRSITIDGLGGGIPNSGTPEKPLELFVENAGTAARFLSALVCLGKGSYRLSGILRMHERPQAALFKALRELWYKVDSANDKLPVVIHGNGAQAGSCTVSIEESSQFASALLMCAGQGRWKVTVVGENTEESPYVQMTRQMIAHFKTGKRQRKAPWQEGSVYVIDPDASSGSYFIAAGWLLGGAGGSQVTVKDWPRMDVAMQIDSAFAKYWPLPTRLSRLQHLGDSIMTAIAIAPFAAHPVEFTDLGRLRVQECERVVGMRSELTKCGGEVVETGDTLVVTPGPLHGADVETYNDHRMAMCFSILGLKVPGIRIKNPACVKKTFPNFFQKLAAPAPHGLGATVLDATTGKPLGVEELFAE